jgi:hypothetical protein
MLEYAADDICDPKHFAVDQIVLALSVVSFARAGRPRRRDEMTEKASTAMLTEGALRESVVAEELRRSAERAQ